MSRKEAIRLRKIILTKSEVNKEDQAFPRLRTCLTSIDILIMPLYNKIFTKEIPNMGHYELFLINTTSTSIN